MTEAAPIRVLIVDDQSLVREGLALIAGSDRSLEVVGQAEDGRAGVAAALQLRPDIVLMDVRMPVMDGIEATAKLLEHEAEAEEIRVIALTTYDSEDFAVRMLAAGASGFLLKDAPGEDLVRAIHTVHAGNAIIDPSMTKTLVNRLTQNNATDVAEDTHSRVEERDRMISMLTARERDVLEYLVQGDSNSQIAAKLFLAEVTVKSHVGRILDKFNLPDRVHVVIWAYESGFQR
ncbi:MAG: response regulator [Gulosibacter sp.]|uniref:response regulator n=1 Tax=Gulosibacter sp. TaxID=2817531 RepID=UPI003F92D255